MTTRPPDQLVLPVFDAFVFVDWFGTLSTARFWDSITTNDRHPLATRMRGALEELFVRKKDLVRAWMRGEVPESEVIDSLQMQLPKGYRDDYLCRQLLRDCRAASINPDMLRLVRELRHRAFVAVASDNMDCFFRATPAVLSGELKIDELIVSSRVGFLKVESPERFFGPTLETYGLQPQNAVLIDDCRETCARFRAWGGHAFHFTNVGTLESDLRQQSSHGVPLLI